VVDWGCGSGVAVRRAAAAWPELAAREFVLVDRSPRAVQFATTRLKELAPNAKVVSGDVNALPAPGLLLISHVITELDGKALARLVELARRAERVIWVEP